MACHHGAFLCIRWRSPMNSPWSVVKHSRVLSSRPSSVNTSRMRPTPNPEPSVDTPPIRTVWSEAPPAGSVRVGLAVRPNPFGRRATISFNLPRAVSAELGIYSVDGRLVRTLPTFSGTVWNGDDNTGNRVGRGVYYCRLQGPALSASMKLVKAE